MKKWLFLLRAFFPSWKFFDDIGPALKLEARFGTNEDTFGDWMNCVPPIRRSLTNFPLNPQGNYLHACNNLLVLLKDDALECDAEQLDERPSYVIARNLVVFQIEQMRLAKASYVYQFRLAANEDHFLISPVYET